MKLNLIKRKLFNLKLPNISFHPLFVGYLAFLLFSEAGQTALITLLVVLIHESGHFIFGKKYGKEYKEIKLYPYGAVIEENDFTLSENEWKIALFGPGINLILGIFSAIILLFNNGNGFWINFLNANITVALFNLLPAYPLDGARAILSISKKPLKILKVLRLSGIVIASVLVGIFILTLFNEGNYSFLIMGVFLFVGSMEGIEKEMGTRIASSLLSKEKNFSKGVPINEIAFDENTPIHKVINKMNSLKITDVVVISNKRRIKTFSEEEILKLATENSPNIKLKEIIN